MQGVVSFLRETKAEWSRITWPQRSEATRLSITVIVVSIVIGAFVGGLDFLFTTLIDTLTKR